MENPYKIQPAKNTIIRGRKKIVDTIIRHVGNISSPHVSLIGPFRIGKSVILNEVSKTVTKRIEHVATVLMWDIHHDLPRTDEEFRSKLHKLLRAQLIAVESQYLSALSNNPTNHLDELCSFGDFVGNDNKKILIIIDGLDSVLRSPQITKNLWDNLRSLAEDHHFIYVTGSRSRLRELCDSPEAQTSDFWNLFYDPIVAGPIESEEYDEYFEALKEKAIGLDKGAKSEIEGWTGGIPQLLMLSIHEIWEQCEKMTLSDSHIKSLMEALSDKGSDYIEDILSKCTSDELDLLYLLAIKTEVPLNECNKELVKHLVQKGFAVRTSASLKINSRFIQRGAIRVGEGLTSIKQYFSDGKNYDKNIQKVLDARVLQLKSVDSEIMGKIKKIITYLDDPQDAIEHVRGIVNRALHLIWTKELTPDKKIPESWIFTWQQNGEKKYFPTFPLKRGEQIALLNDCIDHKLISIQKPTSLLIGNLQRIGNFGHHKDDEHIPLTETEVPYRFMVAVCFSCIEMAELLSKDLNSPIAIQQVQK